MNGTETPHDFDAPAVPPPALEMRGVSKRFGAVQANRDIDMTVAAGSIHGLIGENGAGKSTLMSILYGFYTADSGEILLNGKPCRIQGSRDAIKAGIGMVHQHFMLVEPFTALENVVLGAEGGPLLREGQKNARRALENLAAETGLTIPLDIPVSELSVGQRQRVEILKALYRGAEILILDEPTGVLTPQEADELFGVLGQLRAQGKTVLLVTHKLREIMAITDRVSVMRRGEMVAEFATAKTSPGELAEAMVGRSVLLTVERPPAQRGTVLLSARNLTVNADDGSARLSDVSFDLHAGEILGVAGVSGSGQSELLEVLAGIRAPHAGGVALGDKPLPTGAAAAAQRRRLGLAHVPEDRQRMGLVTSFSAMESAILGYQSSPDCSRGGWLQRDAIHADATDKMKRYDVRPPDPELRTALFSGGNQQKIVLAREIDRDPDVLIVGQPTRGVDIGAIEAIHERLLSLRAAGKAILLVSVELDEIRALSDRIIVMFDGRIVAERPAGADERDLGQLMAGVVDEPGDKRNTG